MSTRSFVEKLERDERETTGLSKGVQNNDGTWSRRHANCNYYATEKTICNKCGQYVQHICRCTATDNVDVKSNCMECGGRYEK